jgi:hypothetical protein
LLGELLLDRANFNIMTRYISDPENLKRMMNLLRSKSRNIQFEAFHVFKVSGGRTPTRLCTLSDFCLKYWLPLEARPIHYCVFVLHKFLATWSIYAGVCCEP